MALNKATADAIIEQLSGATGVLTEGRKWGIRVVATPECIEGLMQSDHPARDAVVANILVTSEF